MDYGGFYLAIVNMLVFLYGSCMGWMSPMILLLQSKDSPRGEPLSDIEVSWMAAVAFLIAVPAAMIIAVLGDRFGRKNTTFLLSALALVCWVIKLLSMEAWAFVLSRSLVGIIMGGVFVTCPLHTKEISEAEIRGMLGSVVILFYTIGYLFLYVIGDILSYRTILWICVTLPVIHIMLLTLVPESPSYLLKRGDIKKATKALAWLRCRREDDIVVLKELEELTREHSKDEESKHFVFKEIWNDKILFRAFKIALVVSLAREACGAVLVLSFAGQIFAAAANDTGLVLTPNQQAMMLGTVQVVGSIMTFGIVDRLGRKGLLFFTSLISGLSMCVLGSWFLALQYDMHAPAWIPVVTLCLCIFCDALGLLTVACILISELFSFKYRSTVMGTAVSLCDAFDFFQMLLFKPVVSNIGPYYVFYFFGAACLLTAIYTIVVIPETKARSLDQIYEDLKTKKEREIEKVKRMAVKQKEMTSL